jgi:chemotaxis methyl-accepting protein methylase
MAEEQQEPTAEAIKQRRKREKESAKNAALGIEKFTVEVAGVFKPDIKRLMKEHGFNNQQEVYQNLLRNVIAADFETAAKMLRCVTTPFVIDEKVSLVFRNESQRLLRNTPGEPEDEIIDPSKFIVSAVEVP